MDEQYITYKKVKEIQFGLISPKLIKQMSNVKVVTPELYDKEGYPVDGGLMDIRMGVIDPGLKCKTCGSKLKECIGHFGYIELARPVIHVNFAKVILDMLRATCRECGKLISAPKEIDSGIKDADATEESEVAIELASDESISEIAVKEKAEKIEVQKRGTPKAGLKCPHCRAKQAKIMIEKPSTYIEEDKRLNPIEIRARLEKISDSDVKKFGIDPKSARPEWMVLTLLAIPPVTIRPSITLESGERSEDDLTHKLGDIVRINQRLFENINAGAPEIIIEDLWDLLQYHTTTFFDNNLPQVPPARHRSGQPLKTLTERIKSKEGRIRHNLVGKRTNFSARTVISPDSMLAINEVGVPKEVATKITVPQRVTEWNKDYLKKFIEAGPKKYPGSNYVERPDGRRKKVSDETKEQLLEELQPGYIVERHLMDGDIAVFNRQPSLHRMSMMAHKVRVLPGLTFRLNPAVCAPYNADFDGDEMNLHIPQTEEARAEAEILMLIQTQLISPRYGLSLIGCNMDAISGNYILTKYMNIKREQAIQILATVGITDFSRLPNKEEVTGKDIFSCVLPEDFNFNGKAKDGTPVIIKNGKLLEGVMDKANLGEGQGLMLRNIHKKYGADETLLILGNIFRLGIKALLVNGLTAGIGDTDLPATAKEKVKAIIEESRLNVNKLIDDYNKGILEAFPGRSLEETLELRIMESLNKARNESGKIVAVDIDNSRHTSVMVHSGAKGNAISLVQMSAVVGQQALRGRRIDKGYTQRTLSCFKKGDRSPKAHGFVEHGFKEGVSPHEFFFMNMTGRDSLMDTALRTPKSGYLYRRLANTMQDIKVTYGGLVQDGSGKIIQFKYGGDNIDISKSEGGSINVKKIVEAHK